MSDHTMPDFDDLFAEQMQLSESQLALDRAALCLAGDEYPTLLLEPALAQMDAMAEAVNRQVGRTPDQRELALALGDYLFDQSGFTGNRDDYYNPDNSFLNRVLETHRGIPISLSLVYMETGRRLGLTCRGVGLPGHFVVGIDEIGLYVDCFNQGTLLSAADCRRLVVEVYGPEFPWQDAFLYPCTRRDILFRMLTNLKHIYLQRGDLSKAISVVRKQTWVKPNAASLYKELSWCHLRLDQYRLAIQDLETYLTVADTPDDAAEVRQQIQTLWTSLSHLN